MSSHRKRNNAQSIRINLSESYQTLQQSRLQAPETPQKSKILFSQDEHAQLSVKNENVKKAPILKIFEELEETLASPNKGKILPGNGPEPNKKAHISISVTKDDTRSSKLKVGGISQKVIKNESLKLDYIGKRE